MKFSEIDSLELLKNGLPPVIKSPAILANFGSIAVPICYLKKPRSVSAEDWKQFLDGFHFELRYTDKS